ncbi:Cycloeucalenol cycloisomerase [Thalictrum thalictroides]|uniref:Cycloeucalenol cycloisomerase n=1 Tax=Thalictrum thalictroides TaxID=46969 RepID=A0A7J6V6R6_THATH|nr:Cycloeucalenol cycloisomerase [Thalictrum thalictroides]
MKIIRDSLDFEQTKRNLSCSIVNVGDTIRMVPPFIAPFLLVGKADSGVCWKDHYWVKANLWIIIFSYVGNYFWTHYFFTVLGASYTFPSWKMNNVEPLIN